MLKTGRSEGVPIVQPAVGRLLRVLVTAVAPKRVLEIGTAIGFSTLWMASALPAGGRIDTIDPDRSRTDRARRYWLRAGVTDRVRVINEPALRVLPRLAPGIEFAFIDALMTEYIAYRTVLRARALDDRRFVLNRAGKLAFIISPRGHEVAQVAAITALEPGCDRFCLYYRNVAAALACGFTAEELMLSAFARAADPSSGGR